MQEHPTLREVISGSRKLSAGEVRVTVAGGDTSAEQCGKSGCVGYTEAVEFLGGAAYSAAKCSVRRA